MTATVIDLAGRRNAAVKSHFCDPAKKNGCGATDPSAFAPNEHSRCRDCRKKDKRAWHAAHGRSTEAPKLVRPAAPEPVEIQAQAADGVDATCTRDAFCAALNDVLKVVGKTPVLGGVRIEAKGTVLTLTSTDLDVTVERTVGADVRIDGVALIPGKLAHALVTRMPRGTTLTLSSSDNGVSLTAGGRSASLEGLSADDFPKEVTGAFSEPVVFDAAELVSALRAAVTTASTDEAHLTLCGVWFDFTPDGRMDLVSTDKYRLGIAPVHYSGTVPVASGSVLVPAKALKLLAGMVDGAEVTAAFSETHVALIADGLRMVVRLTLGRIPNYRKFLPAEGPALTLTASMLTEAVSYVATVAGANTPIALAVGGETLTVQASQKGVGKASEQVVVANGGVEEMTWTADPDFIAAGLRYVGSPSVEFQLTGPTAAAVIRGGGRAYVLMPYIVNAAA